MEGVLSAAGLGPNRAYADFHKLARELRRHATERGWKISYDQSLDLISAAMGYKDFKAARRKGRAGVIFNREPSLDQLDSPAYQEFVKLDAAGGYKAGSLTVTMVPSDDGEAITLSGRFMKLMKKFFNRHS